MFLIAMVYLSQQAVAQGTSVLSVDPFLFLASPQTCDFVRYGNLPVSHYTGQAKITIPIYEYKDNDFEIPIFLSYNSSGFMPNKKEGIVGLNWALNAGGVITRKVNGVPDDKDGISEMMGWYAGIQKGKISNVTNEQLFNIQVGAPDEYWTTSTSNAYKWHINNTETQPDEFIFNAPGIQGSFYIGVDGSVICKDNQPYKVALNLAIQPHGGQIINCSSSIIITSDDGFQFHFGGSVNSLEITYQEDDPTKDNDHYRKYDKYLDRPSAFISGWHLTRIIAPNGRSIEYTYADGNNSRPNEAQYPCVVNKYVVNNISYSRAEVVASSIHQVSSDKEEFLTEITKPAYLNSIEVENTVINFNYEKTLIDGKMCCQLSNVSIQYKTGNTYNLIDGISFIYKRLGAGYPRLFLTAVQKRGIPPYRFSYYNTERLPDPLTRGVDHWGFWNGKDNNPLFIPYDGTNKNPDFNYSKVGILDTIQYPTGGFSKFYYEPHDYSWRLERLIGENVIHFPSLSEKTGIAGGVRIKKIEDSDGEDIYNTKEYIYKVSNTSKSSGILMNYPQYSIDWHYTKSEYKCVLKYNPNNNKFEQVCNWVNTLVVGFSISSNSFHTNYYPGENYIHYSDVKEVYSPDKSYKIYTFNNYLSCPDKIDYNFKLLPSNIPTTGNVVASLSSIPGFPLSSRFSERGLPKKISTYDKNGEKVEEELFEYTGQTDYPNDWKAGIINSGFFSVSYKIYHYPVKPKKETVTQYINGREYTTITDYSYNMSRKNGYLIKQTTTDSENLIHETQYRYVEDLVAAQRGNYNAMQWLKNKNIINVPIEKLEYKNGHLIDASFLSYNTFSLSATRNVYPDKSLKLESSAPVLNYNNTGLDVRLKPDVQYERYDEVGNILQLRKKDNIPVSFLWSYGKRYPVAELQGATYNEIIQKLGDNEIKMIAETHFTDEELREKLKTLKELLPNAMVTIYTHNPLVGISSKTDSNGITTYYEYDNAGRLKTVKEHVGNILLDNEYKYGFNVSH